MILAGDVGGTKCNLGLFLQDGPALRSVFQRRLATRDYAGFEDLVEEFLKQAIAADANSKEPAIEAAGFGVAGGGGGGGGSLRETTSVVGGARPVRPPDHLSKAITH